MANPHPKPGPGRPKGSKATHTIEAENAREYIIKRVSEELEPILDKLIEKAKAGDMVAAKDLLDRAYGKATETLKHEGLEFLFDDEKSEVDKVVGKLV